jgi:hypothetical protein
VEYKSVIGLSRQGKKRLENTGQITWRMGTNQLLYIIPECGKKIGLSYDISSQATLF